MCSVVVGVGRGGESEKRLSFLFSFHVVGRGVNTVVIPTHKIQLNTYFKNLLQKFIKNITPNKENRFEPQKHRFAINRSQNESTKNRFFFNKNNRFLNNRIDSAHHYPSYQPPSTRGPCAGTIVQPPLV
jgi:hypothetical protein